MMGLDHVRLLAREEHRSPMMRTLGIELVGAEEGRVDLVATPTAGFVNQAGIMHGGWIASLLDEACGMAAHTVQDGAHYCLTLELKASYLGAIDAGAGPLAITGRVRKGGRAAVFTEAVVTDGEGRELAQASSTLIVREMAPARLAAMKAGAA